MCSHESNWSVIVPVVAEGSDWLQCFNVIGSPLYVLYNLQTLALLLSVWLLWLLGSCYCYVNHFGMLVNYNEILDELCEVTLHTSTGEDPETDGYFGPEQA